MGGSVTIIYLAQIFVANSGVESVFGLQSCHSATLLIESYEQVAIGIALQLRSEGAQALARGDVARAYLLRTGEVDVEKNHAAHLQVAHVAHGIAVGGDAIGFKSHH